MFNEKIKLFREANKLTQNEVAEYLNISPQSVSKWERGESLPNIDHLPKLSKLYKCKIDDFFNENSVESIADNQNAIKNINVNSVKNAFDILKTVYIDNGDKAKLKDFLKHDKDTINFILTIAKYMATKNELNPSILMMDFKIGYMCATTFFNGFDNLNLTKTIVANDYKVDLNNTNHFISFLSSL